MADMRLTKSQRSIKYNSAERKHDYDALLKCAIEMIEFDDEDPDGYRRRAYAKEKIGDTKGANADYEKALYVASCNMYIVYIKIAKTKKDMNDDIGAIEAYTKAIEIYEKTKNQPNEDFYQFIDPTLNYYYRGLLKNDTKDYKGAIEDFDSLYADDWNKGMYPEAFQYRGLAKMNIEDYKGAIEDFTKCSIHNRDNLYYRGIAKTYLNDWNGACEDWTKAVELGDTSIQETINKHCNKN